MGTAHKIYREESIQIEIIEFYPLTKEMKDKNFIGTMHIYLIEQDLHIRGVCVYRKDLHYKFVLPYKYTLNHLNKKFEWYPIINFTSQRKNKELLYAIHLKGTKFIKQFYEKRKSDEKIKKDNDLCNLKL